MCQKTDQGVREFGGFIPHNFSYSRLLLYFVYRNDLFFFFLFDVAEFYGSGDTWFAVALIPDNPAGNIVRDFHRCEDLDRQAPGGRARIALKWVLNAFARRLKEDT